MTNWRGKAHNPKGFEPDAHQRFQSPSKKAIDAYREGNEEQRKALPEKLGYNKIMEYYNAGEAGVIGHFAAEMTFDVYMGIEDELVENSIDVIVRTYPDYVPRANDIIEYAMKCSKAKMRGFITHDHFFPSIGQAWGAQMFVDEMVRRGELEQACQCFGTLSLNWSHHPDQINLIRKYPNLGGVYFWCQSAGGRNCGPPQRTFDEKGNLDSEVKEVIGLCAQYKIPINTGHAFPGYDQLSKLTQYAHEVGAHLLMFQGQPMPGGRTTATIKQYKELIKLGLYIGVTGNKVLPSIIWPCVDPNAAMDWMMEMGPDHIIPNTDGGQPFFGDALDIWRMYIRAMLHFGIPKEDIKTMIQTNPAKYLYLDE